MEQAGFVQADEAARLLALQRYNILDTPAEPKFDRIVRMASRMLEMPISLVSLIDEARQWFKARVGMERTETPRSMSLCAHAIQADDVMIVEDATLDPRFVANPLVTGDLKIRFYAGAPLTTNDGYRLGTLCVIDRVPRHLTEQQKLLMEDLAALVVDEMELRRVNALLTQLATTDSLSGLWNRRAFFALAEGEHQRAMRYRRPLSALMIDIDHFKGINDQYGHDLGDKVIVQIARVCEAQKRNADIAARVGGEEFVVLMPETDLAGACEFAERLRQAIARERLHYDGAAIGVTVSIGAAEANEQATIDDLLKHADLCLYKAKHDGRDRVSTSTMHC